MKHSLIIHPRVTREVGMILAYHESDRSGSGIHFLEALDECYDSILLNPKGYALRKGSFRHALLHKLKYRVVYRVDGAVVYVVQVRHTSRKPSKKFGP